MTSSQRYADALPASVGSIPRATDRSYVAHLAVVVCRDRAALAESLGVAGIETAVHYPVPDHRQPVLPRDIRLPVTEHLAASILTLPCFPELAESEIAQRLRGAAARRRDRRMKPDVSIVIPVYGNEATIPALIARLDGYAAQLAPARMEAVFVVDGSPDRSGERIRELLPEATFDAQLVWHARNFGAFAAIRTGLEAAAGEAIAVMAADLQEPEETILEMLAPIRAGTADVVLATRTGRDDSWSVRVTSAAFWRTYRRLVQRDAPAGGVDMFACTTAVRDVLVSLRESNTSLVGLLMWAGYRRRSSSTGARRARTARAAGRSGAASGTCSTASTRSPISPSPRSSRSG